jgi:hypothetical protein
VQGSKQITDPKWHISPRKTTQKDAFTARSLTGFSSSAARNNGKIPPAKPTIPKPPPPTHHKPRTIPRSTPKKPEKSGKIQEGTAQLPTKPEKTPVRAGENTPDLAPKNHGILLVKPQLAPRPFTRLPILNS